MTDIPSPAPPLPVRIAGTGSYVPERVMSNAELEKIVDTSDDWITSRTGIKERRIARANEFTSHMAAKAGQRALEQAEIDPAGDLPGYRFECWYRATPPRPM